MAITPEQVESAVQTATLIASVIGATCAWAIWALRRKLVSSSSTILNVVTVVAFVILYIFTGIVHVAVTHVLVNRGDATSQIWVNPGWLSRLLPIGTALIVFFLLTMARRPQRLSAG